MTDLRIGCIGAMFGCAISAICNHFGLNLIPRQEAMAITMLITFVAAVALFGAPDT